MMTTFRYITIAFFFVAIPVSLLAGDEALDGLKANEDRWDTMTVGRKKAIVETYKEWKALSQPRREAIREKFDKFRALDPEQREVVAVNAPRWVNLEEEKRSRIRTYFHGRDPHCQPNRFGPPPPPRGFLRLVGTLLEEGREVSMPAILDRFVEQLKARDYLTAKQFQAYSAVDSDRKKFEVVGLWLLKQALEADPDALKGLERGTEEYKRACHELGAKAFSDIAEKLFEPTQLEMATFIRFRARRHLTFEKQRAIASYSSAELDEFARQVYEKDGIDLIVAQMPERMRERFNSFDEAKRLATIRMVFEPIHKMHGPPPPPNGDEKGRGRWQQPGKNRHPDGEGAPGDRPREPGSHGEGRNNSPHRERPDSGADDER